MQNFIHEDSSSYDKKLEELQEEGALSAEDISKFRQFKGIGLKECERRLRKSKESKSAS